MGSYTIVGINVGVFKTVFGVEPLKIKPGSMLNIYNFIRENTEAHI